jgi:Flp pilus assembly protein TadD
MKSLLKPVTSSIAWMLCLIAFAACAASCNIKITPKEVAEAHARKGFALLDEGRFEEALALFQYAAKIEPAEASAGKPLPSPCPSTRHLL